MSKLYVKHNGKITESFDSFLDNCVIVSSKETPPDGYKCNICQESIPTEDIDDYRNDCPLESAKAMIFTCDHSFHAECVKKNEIDIMRLKRCPSKEHTDIKDIYSSSKPWKSCEN